MALGISIVVLVIGLVVYLRASGPRTVELGRLTFAVGLLVSLWQLAGLVLMVR